MTTKQEMAMLRNISRPYENCSKAVATSTRWRWAFSGVAMILLIVAFRLSSNATANPKVCLVIAMVSGMLIGLSALFSASARQMPLLVRYTTLNTEEIQKRLEELKAVRPCTPAAR